MSKAATTKRKRSESAKQQRWSAEVMRKSNALDLEKDVFTWDDPGRIARSLRDSARQSKRRKGTEYQSAMSMLNFYINRAGKKLPPRRLKTLQEAKSKLRELFQK